jgi:peptidoglycan/LPS O-acetylase OafA/YrhL
LTFKQVFLVHACGLCGNPSWVVAGFDFLRCIPIWNSWLDFYMGVSGFSLFWSVLHTPGPADWTAYARRRAWRILPPYYAAMALVVGLIGLYGVRPGAHSTLGVQVLTHLLLVHSLFLDTATGLIPSFWYISLEAQFYVIFPFLVGAYRKRGLWLLAWVTGLSLVYRYLCVASLSQADLPHQMLPAANILGRCIPFVAGMVAARVVSACAAGELTWSAARSLACGVSGLLLIHYGGFWSLGTQADWPIGDLMLGYGFAALMVAVVAWPEGWPSRWLSHPALLWVGTVSYSLYLVHQSVEMVVSHEVPPLSPHRMFVVLCTVGLALSLLLAAVFHRFLGQLPTRQSMPRRPSPSQA